VINFLASSDPKYCCKGKTHKRVHSVHCRESVSAIDHEYSLLL